MTDTSTLTLTDFLLARIAEDEAVARAPLAQPKPDGPAWFDGSERLYGGAHVSRWSPARVLAECEAKRRIVEEAIFWRDKTPHSPNAAAFARWLLAKSAAVYADHPDFRPEWRP